MASHTSSDTTEGPLDITLNGSSSSVTPDRYGFIGSSESNLSTSVGADVIRRREQKWLDMLNNWDEYMTKDFKTVRSRCKKGIPASLRARAWLFLCGGKIHMDQNPNLFLELTHDPGNKKWIDDIKKDLHRQFPLHEIFAQNGGYGQGDLYLILKAYTILNPEIGYCQAQAPVAATLLMHMPAEQAFWCLVSISDKYLTGYYSPGLDAVQLDGAILFGLLRKIDYHIYKHLKKQKIEPVLYMTEWFLCIFSRTLPWPSVLRVWDMFFCEGVKVLFRVGLVLLRLALGSSETRKKCPSMSETLQVLWNIPEESLQEDKLQRELDKINLTVYDMEKEHHKQQRRRKLADNSR